MDRTARLEQELESLCSEILERYEEATLVYRLCERLGSSLGEDAIARAVVEDAAAVLGATTAALWLTADGSARLAAAVPAVPDARSYWHHVEASVLRHGRPWLREGCERRAPVVAVPLPGEGADPIGALVFEGRTDGRPYRTGETKLLGALASLAAAFIRNDRLAARARQADLERREDEIARAIHRRLLPRHDPVFEGVEISGSCLAAESVGGDYYGYLPMPDGSLGVALADICGHGVGAAIYMAGTKSAIQTEAHRTSSPGELLRQANTVLSSDFAPANVFATAFVARVRPGGRRVEYANAGHHPPLLIRAGGTVETLRAGGAAPLGVREGQTYREHTVALTPGDRLVLYTDGLVEARGADRAFYGAERLAALLRRCGGASASRLCELVLADLDRHCGSVAPQDDVTLVVVRATKDGAGR